MKFKYIVMCLVTIWGCNTAEQTDYEERKQNHYETFEGPGAVFDKYTEGVSQIDYLRDKRTNLCFAYFWTGGYHGGPGFSNVPCSDEVLKLIKGTNVDACNSTVCPNNEKPTF